MIPSPRPRDRGVRPQMCLGRPITTTTTTTQHTLSSSSSFTTIASQKRRAVKYSHISRGERERETRLCLLVCIITRVYLYKKILYTFLLLRLGRSLSIKILYTSFLLLRSSTQHAKRKWFDDGRPS